MGRVATALLDADVQLAWSVIGRPPGRWPAARDLENLAVALLAWQQPVATDLRTAVTSLRMNAGPERAGDLAQHVAELVRLRFPGTLCRATCTARRFADHEVLVGRWVVHLVTGGHGDKPTTTASVSQ